MGKGKHFSRAKRKKKCYNNKLIGWSTSTTPFLIVSLNQPVFRINNPISPSSTLTHGQHRGIKAGARPTSLFRNHTQARHGDGASCYSLLAGLRLFILQQPYVVLSEHHCMHQRLSLSLYTPRSPLCDLSTLSPAKRLKNSLFHIVSWYFMEIIFPILFFFQFIAMIIKEQQNKNKML